MPDQTTTPLTDDELREIADTAAGEMLPDETVQAMAVELLAARVVTPETSDGYHTFAELYHYRMLYNAALFNEWAAADRYVVHKSIRHADGELCFGGGWFVVYAQLPTGQISNHSEMTHWDRFRVPERDRAAEWDGHTPQQVAERLAAFLKLGPGGPRFSQRHLEQVTRQRDEARERIAELEAQRRPPSLRQYLQAFSDRDEAQSRAAELAERVAELEAQQGEPISLRPADVGPWQNVHSIVEQAIRKAKQPTEDRDGNQFFSRDNLTEAIRLLIAATNKLELREVSDRG
ncbi:hypothetical protein IU421_13450 [Nocardia cyriacigeorgica]|uniref:WDGH domain-containing protein n=1 Tax=Nocardia cyriacigeorgica TaxID=135487 RepID=UPI0018953541|nr:hypothetical protein [Nocardia cyriacigeorgica]MBF6515287.1 hypothetical protein [Nocardia cyriacigeorgica]